MTTKYNRYILIILFSIWTNTFFANTSKVLDFSEGNVVGSIPGKLNVEANGAASYTIPIECPAGINGMQPKLSLVYNSQGGDGPLGVGWSISGLSSIYKTTKNIYSDNAIAGINKSNDTYALDGNKLFIKNKVIPDISYLPNKIMMYLYPEDYDIYFQRYSNWYTSSGSTYETENKSYSQIETVGLIPFIDIYHPSSSTTSWKIYSYIPRYFKVTNKDGRIIEYAVSKNKTISTSEDSISDEWFVSKITDSNGNFINFTYKSSAGQTVIQKIEYTGNGSTLPFYSLVFNYDTKTVAKRTYYGNIYNEDKYLLKSIQILSKGTTLKQYDLSYAIRKEKNYLENITLTGLNSQKLNSTTFAWGKDNDVINVNSSSAPEPYSQQTVNKSDRYWLAVDMNGDGTDEIINIYPAKIINQSTILTKDYIQAFKPIVSNGQISLVSDAYYDMGVGLSYENIKSTNPSILIGDINGDEKKELIFPKLDLTNGAKVKFQVAGGTTYERPLKYSSQLPVCAVADINNDGIDEIIYLEKGKTDANSEYVNGEVCYTNNSNLKTWVPISVNLGLGLTALPLSIIPADIDNDGLIDFIVTSNGGYEQCMNAGNASNTLDYKPVSFTDGGYSNDFSGTYKTILKGDFDGDGSVDFLTNAPNSNYWNIQLNNGTTFAPIYENGGSTANILDKEDCIVTDFNHDGKSDVILVNRVKNSSGIYIQTIVTWYASTGTTFIVAKTFTTSDQSYSYRKYNCTGDFDGDGREDVLSYGSDLYNGGNKSDQVFIQRAFNTNFEANQIKTITDGFGKMTQLTYQPLTYTTTADNKPFYSKGTSSAYPVADIQLPLYCISRISEPDGQGGTNTTEFAYSEARVQLIGRGFLGFKSMTTSNDIANRKVVSITDMNQTLYLPDKQTIKVSTANGTAVSETENYYSNSKTGNIFLTQPQQTIENDYLNDLSKTTNYLSFDEYGNATVIKTTQGDLISTQTCTYVQKGSWCPNKPESVSVTRQQGTDTYTRSMSYAYDDKGNRTKEITDSGDINQKTVEYKGWNIFGQPTKTETTANGILRSTSISFTPSGRYIQSKTDVLGQTTTYNWDETRGLLNSEVNRLGTTTYTYNEMGQLTKTQYPDGTYKSQTTQWATSGNAFGASFYVYQETSGAAPVYSWFDILQREVVRETYGLNNKKSRVFTQYRTDGKTDRVSAPTFNSQAGVWDAIYNYYDDGRVQTVTTPLGVSTTTYNGKTTTVATTEGIRTTILNTAGQVQTSTVNGKTVTYNYYASGQAKSAKPDDTPAVVMGYDLQGNRTKLTDPDAGTTVASYNGFGELKWQKLTNNSAQGEITCNYNYNSSTGLLESRVRNGETTSYGYDDQKRINSVEIAGQHKQTYTYGDYDRVTKVTELIGTKSFDKQLAYDTYGRVTTETFPSGYSTLNHYDEYGNLTEVTDRSNRSIWKITEANARGQQTKVSKGAKETVYGYNETKGQQTAIVVPGVVKYSFGYDTKNNLAYRCDSLINQKEQFTYDIQNRLTNWDIYSTTTNVQLKANSISYDALGNIATKSDLDNFTMNYGEENGKPHALTSITDKPGAISENELTVGYTDFRKIKALAEGNKQYSIAYGIDDQRKKSEYTVNGITLTRYYLGNYEEETDNLGNVKKIHYLSGGAMLIQKNSVETLYYGYTDNQGSLIALTDQNGNLVEKYAYDPWGARRDPSNWTMKDTRTSWITNRGYTGHEHLDAFSIINMNGRVYDPLTAMFFSPDPFIQSPDDWLNYNRYSYVMNNPTRFTDPTGCVLAQQNAPVFADGASELMSYASGGGGAWPVSSFAGGNAITYDYYSNSYINADGEKVSTEQGLNYLYSGTKVEYSFRGNAASEAYKILHTDYILTEIKLFSGDISYALSLGDLGKLNVSPNGGVTFSNPTAAGTSLSYWNVDGNEQGGGNYTWTKKLQLGLGAFDVGAGAKGNLIDWAVAGKVGKTIKSLEGADYIMALGKGGAKYVNGLKVLGVATFAASATISGVQSYNYYKNGGTGNSVWMKSLLDVGMGAVGFCGPIGFGISTTYFLIDAAGGFGNWGNPLK